MRFSAEVLPRTFAANVDRYALMPPAGSVIGIDMARPKAWPSRAALRPHSDAADAFLYGLEGSNLNDLTERFRATERARETDAEFQAYVDRLLAEKPSQWPEYAFWMLVSTMFTVGIFGVCACLAG